MSKPIKLKFLLKVLEEKGFFFVSQNGSHAKYRKNELTILTAIVPIHGKEITHGTFRSILRQSKLQQGDFEK
jgi:predicted RNA binding protein YcfA (HicA-like mRNA interferase family)